MKNKTNKKKILMIATGGTIASRPSELGMAPDMTGAQILETVPEISASFNVDTIELMNLDSTNVCPDDWQRMANCIAEHYEDYDGFVITHGTDTMAYTAGALTYLIQNIGKSVVLTGAQQSIFYQNTDARTNLMDAFRYAADDLSHGVTLVFDGKVIAGARARKMRTKSFNAFESIDYPALAVLINGKIFHYIVEPMPIGNPVFYSKLNDRVVALKLIPGMNADVILYLKAHYDALVIESFGVGGLPSYGDEDFLRAIDSWSQDGKIVVMTTQVPFEGSDMSVYAVGGKVVSRDIIEAYTMTLESVVTKLMWILAQTKNPNTARTLFYIPVAHDLLAFT